MDIKQAASAYNTIAGIGKGAGSTVAASPARGNETVSFMDMVNHSLNAAVETGEKAEEISKLALMGKTDINSLVVAVNGAERVLQEVVAIRDKVISAYQQIMQMPV